MESDKQIFIEVDDGGCELSVDNEEDCAGNYFPTCGGCLWAQGLIQCP